MIPEVLERARLPFPVGIRTLDALHLTSIAFLIEQGQPVALATYDERMRRAATGLGIEVLQLA